MESYPDLLRQIQWSVADCELDAVHEARLPLKAQLPLKGGEWLLMLVLGFLKREMKQINKYSSQ